jgi:hypothetical protein
MNVCIVNFLGDHLQGMTGRIVGPMLRQEAIRTQAKRKPFGKDEARDL